MLQDLFKTVVISLGVLIIGASMSMANETDVSSQSFYSYKATDINGKEVLLSKYEGKVSLVVNTASNCGYTPQYADLQEIYQKYSGEGFTVLGFPSNDFGGQEPGTNDEIAKFCSGTYDVTFPLFSKQSVRGDEIQAPFAFLTSNAPEAGAVKWNFEKFLIDQEGKVIARYRSSVRPNDKQVTSQIEKLLEAEKATS